MIPYVEILNKYSLKAFALVEPSECWFELSYYDVGEFEIYCRASSYNLNALQKGHYVKIPNKRFIWVITSIQYTFNAEGARMISAKGYEAKWLLKKRIILNPIELPNTLSGALFKLINDNIGTGASAARKINNFDMQLINIDINLSDTQAPRGNLLEFVNNLLTTYHCGSQVTYEEGKLIYKIIQGQDKTQIVKFSQSFDNLLSSSYSTNDEDVGTYALVVSTVDDVDYTKEVNYNNVGIDRNEILVNSNLSTKYEDANGVEQDTTPTSALYKGWQYEEGKNELAKHVTIEDVSSEIDLTNSVYTFDVDFFIGDIVRVQDEYFNYYINSRVLKYTFKQDAKGYGEEAEYGGQ